MDGKVADLFDPAKMVVELSTTNDREAEKILVARGFELLHDEDPEVVFARVSRERIPELAPLLVNAGIGILALHPRHSLEDYFLSLTSAKYGAHKTAN